VLRAVIRWPLRSLLTATGLGAATAAIISAAFMGDAMDHIIDQAFHQSYRQDAMILFSQDLPLAALQEVERLPGVIQAEAQQFHAVTLRNGPLEKSANLEARPHDAELSRVIASDGRPATALPGGLMLSERLAEQLGLAVGDRVEIEFRTGLRETHEMVVTSLIQQYLGLGVYADMATLDTLLRRAPMMSVANVLIDPRQIDALTQALQDTPALSGMIHMTDNRDAFDDTINENISVVNGVYTMIAVLITIGVAYNGARIQLSERARELASLRILGFSRAEVSGVLVGETMLLAVLAQPIGWALGAWIAHAMSNAFTSDLYAVPFVLEPSSFAVASLVVLGTSFGSVMLVRRRIDRMDLVAVMKTRE